MKSIRPLPLVLLALVGCVSYQPSGALSDVSPDTGVVRIAADDIDSDRPMGTRPNRTENYPYCVSDVYDPNPQFINTGSLCIDGMVALISGRGCEDLIYETDGEGIHHMQCGTEATCDVVHSDHYIAIPNDINWLDYGNQGDLMCQDQNVTLLISRRGIPQLREVQSSEPETFDTGR